MLRCSAKISTKQWKDLLWVETLSHSSSHLSPTFSIRRTARTKMLLVWVVFMSCAYETHDWLIPQSILASTTIYSLPRSILATWNVAWVAPLIWNVWKCYIVSYLTIKSFSILLNNVANKHHGAVKSNLNNYIVQQYCVVGMMKVWT